MTPTLHILLVMVTMHSGESPFAKDQYTIVKNYGENHSGCQLESAELNGIHSWKKRPDGTSVRYECHSDNILPRQYTNQDKQEPGYAGPMPKAPPSKTITVYGGGSTYRVHVPSY